MPDSLADATLRRFFAETVRRCFEELDIPDDGTAGYLADVLARFSRLDAMHPVAPDGATLVSLADRLAAIQRAWAVDGPHFDPARELELRQGMADYALVMHGFFWERIRDCSAQRHHVREGRRAYRFLAEYHRAQESPEAATYAALAARFDTYAAVLSYLRDVHLGADFVPGPHRTPARFIVP